MKHFISRRNFLKAAGVTAAASAMAAAVPHQREAARQHALVGQRRQKLSGMVGAAEAA